MSERILNALMQLFAIIAKIDDHADDSDSETLNTKGHQVIRSFLKGELSPEKVEEYVQLFDKHFNSLRSPKKSKVGGAGKRNAVTSVKVLRICSEINLELTRRQKFVVLVRILELILEDTQASNLELEFVRTVADTFNIKEKEYNLIFSLLMNEIDLENPGVNSLILTGKKKSTNQHIVHIHSLSSPIIIIRIESLNLLFFKFLGNDEIFMNGQLLRSKKVYLFSQGGTLKTTRSQPIYQSDVLSRFISENSNERFVFETNEITYKFKGRDFGLHPFSFQEESGKLVGIMGGSGTGKSTLINILNGSIKPTTGTVTINGIDIHANSKEVEGLIGYISQDDLLIEELSVFENLFFSAKLCFSDLNERELTMKVIRMLNILGLYQIRDLVVGNPLEKTISGGQRKRLNIALELIREPSVLFVDEPTSGLSSRDSMTIMNLLKELSFRGKLIFVVIHQPSSEIFKLFNRLLLMDQGGYPIFNGNPADALPYFKRQYNYANADENECSLCGNVNPEQLFDIIEAKVVDEFGHSTNMRKTEAKAWYEMYRDSTLSAKSIPETRERLHSHSQKQPKIAQFKVFFTRDFKSKIANKQYLLVTLLEAPMLAAILAFFMKFVFNSEKNASYSFFKNENIPYFIFISVLVSIFFGMTVAAEEINKDKRILKREQFLNLSRGSYLMSKISILCIISFIQTGTFMLVGNSILEINNLWLDYWAILFSTSVCANVIALNISSAFNLAKVIYIIVPIFIIPQLLFSGALVKFNRLHPTMSHPTEVPWIGNLMISRWAYEALAVEQATSNEFDKLTYDLKRQKSESSWKKDYWIPEMTQLIQKKSNSPLVISELRKEQILWKNLSCSECWSWKQTINKEEIEFFLRIVKLQYIDNYNKASAKLEALKQNYGIKKYGELKEQFSNENLNNIVQNSYSFSKIIVDRKGNDIVQTEDPIYINTINMRFLDSPLFSKTKHFFGIEISTFWGNMIVIWLFSIFAYIALQYDWLKKILEYSKFKFKK